tara:strand:+ start:1169 stop:1540 length:372 start_codon:yes stop_codon:yes gene_type:complete
MCNTLGVLNKMSESEIVVQIPRNESKNKKGNILRIIFAQITSGVGFWGSLQPIVAILFSLIPFLFLGQHFNRSHQKGIDFGLLQIPLALTGILWICLYLWSIFDAWNEAQKYVLNKINNNQYE